MIDQFVELLGRFTRAVETRIHSGRHKIIPTSHGLTGGPMVPLLVWHGHPGSTGVRRSFLC